MCLCSLESLEEMPADDIEIIEGDEEGVISKNSLGPKEILLDERGHRYRIGADERGTVVTIWRPRAAS